MHNSSTNELQEQVERVLEFVVHTRSSYRHIHRPGPRRVIVGVGQQEPKGGHVFAETLDRKGVGVEVFFGANGRKIEWIEWENRSDDRMVRQVKGAEA